MKKIAVLLAGVLAVVVAAAAFAKGPETFKVSAKLTLKAEVPKATAPAAATGAFAATVKESGNTANGDVEADLRASQRGGLRGAHPQGQARCARSGHRVALRPLP